MSGRKGMHIMHLLLDNWVYLNNDIALVKSPACSLNKEYCRLNAVPCILPAVHIKMAIIK